MKWLKRISLSILIAIPAMILLIYLLLWIPPVQQKIKNIALNEVSKITKNKITIERFTFRPFSKLVLEDVYIADLQGDTLLHLDKLNAGFNLFELLNDRLLINSIELETVTANIYKDSLNAPFNFQFLIDAFTSKDTVKSKEPSKMVIEIDDVRIKNGNIRYYISSEDTLGNGVFDSNHIHLTNLDLDIQLRSIDPEKLNIKLKNLTFKEQSGFKVKKLTGKLISKDGKLNLEELTLQLPHSILQLKSLNLDYSEAGINNIMSKASYSLNMEESVLFPGDLTAFSDKLTRLKDSLIFSGKLEGQFPEIKISRFQASMGNTANLDISARIADFNHWQTSALEISVNKLFLSEKVIEESKITSPSEALNTGNINLSGKISGTLPNLNVDLQASSDLAKLAINGMAGYTYDTGKAQADMQLDIDRFKYNGYTYQNVHAHGKYVNDSINLSLSSKDINAPIELMVTGNLNPAKESVKLSANINHLRLDITNWLPAYPGAEIYGKVKADIKGFNPEKMKALLTVDSLMFKTNKNTFNDKQLKINYLAEKDNNKNLIITSDLLDMSLTGNFRLNSIGPVFQQTLSEYTTLIGLKAEKKSKSKDQLKFNLSIKNPEIFEKTLNLPFFLPGTTTIKGEYFAERSSIELQANISDLVYGENHFSGTSINLETDTILHKIDLKASTQSFNPGIDSLIAELKLYTIENGVSLTIDIEDKTPQMNISGKLAADVHLGLDKKDQLDNVLINIQPGDIIINKELFKLSASQISLLLKEEKYNIKGFAIAHENAGYLNIDGDVSKNPSDSLKLNFTGIRLKTLADAGKLNVNLGGEANGEIILKELLTTPLIFTKGFSIKDISLENKKIGTLNLISGWSREAQALMFKLDLVRDNMPNSTVEGKISPTQNQIQAEANINTIPLDWLSPFTSGTLFGLSGHLGFSAKASGNLKSPKLDGIFYTNNANIGVSMLNTQYKFSDTIKIASNQINIENFRITDENNHSAILSGNIRHEHFSNFNPNLDLNIKDFLVLNNAQQMDSLFYGNLRINGNVKITSKDKNILLNARLTNSENSTIMVTIPESAEEAQRYSSITFINTGEDTTTHNSAKNRKISTSQALPVKLNISLIVDPGLKLGALINPQTKDAATVTGTGNIDFSYDMANSRMSLLGVYTVKDGHCTLSLKNITKKSFSIKEGGTLTFKGDPMSTAFNITALYSTRADLGLLDKNFETIMANTKVPVNATLSVSGDLNKMNLKYDIEYPTEKEEIKRKADGLMYSDDIKIREFAYLLAFNTFFPINSTQSRNMGTDLWTSLASSTITSQLNNLLSGVLNENWSIGTELHANDKNLSDVEMDVNVSTRLFDDRMTVNSNIGYKNNSTTADNNNFTGDFDIQFKLTKSGNVVLKVYDITNNQYFDKAKRTQGVGIVYKKEARTFKRLFQKIKSIIKK